MRKALKIQGKRRKNCLSTASKPPVALRSSASVKLHIQTAILTDGSFFIARAAFVIPERLPVPAQASEWGHLRHEVPQALRPSRSAVQQALIGRTYQTPEVCAPGVFNLIAFYPRIYPA